MNGKTIIKGVAVAAMAIGAIDLLFGNTGQSPLPTSLTNNLTQQTDFVLLAGGAAAFWLM